MLSDKEKRQKYDTYGHDAFQDGDPFGGQGPDIQDILRQFGFGFGGGGGGGGGGGDFFGFGGGGGGGPERGENIEVPPPLSLSLSSCDGLTKSSSLLSRNALPVSWCLSRAYLHCAALDR